MGRNFGETMRRIYLILIAALFSGFRVTSAMGTELEKRRPFFEECQSINQYIVKNKFRVDCFFNYHHYNAPSSLLTAPERPRNIRLGSYNLLHPGMGKTKYKDYYLLAKVLNQFDLVATQELIPFVGQKSEHNERVLTFIKNGPFLTKKLQERIDEARNRNDGDNYQLLKERLGQLKSDLKTAPTLFEAPGYLRLLQGLQSLDASWALILSPRGSAAAEHQLQELVGIYYRNSAIEPAFNPHCQKIELSHGEIPLGPKIACLADFGEKFMGIDSSNVFSRDPFLASFKSGEFNFSFLTSHLVYKSPQDSEQMASILRPSFGVTHFSEIPYPGVNADNYARIAEAKVIVQFMGNYQQAYPQDNILYAGDMNLEKDLPFWPHLFKGFFPDGEVFVDWQTSLAKSRFEPIEHSNQGLSKNYDHFIFRPESLKNCFQNDKANLLQYTYFSGPLSLEIQKKYLIRPFNQIDETSQDEYQITPEGQDRVQMALESKLKEIKSKMTIRRSELSPYFSHPLNELKKFEQRIFLNQLKSKTFYRLYYEVLSDHLPIGLGCSTR